MIRIGINGFGRIGRAVFRNNEDQGLFEIAAVNDVDPDISNHSYLLKYDSVYGRFKADLSVDHNDHALIVNGKKAGFYSFTDISDVPWQAHDIDVLIDATGVSHNVVSSKELIARGVIKKVIVTHVPREGVDLVLIFGSNEDEYDPLKDSIISTSICDAVAAVPVLSLIEKEYGIEDGYITTLHPWLSYQNLLDGTVRSVSSPGHYWSDFALGRSSPFSLIPKETTLVEAISLVLPDVASRLQAISFRVPTNIVCAADLTLTLKKTVTDQEMNSLLNEAAHKNPRIIGYEEDSLVSIDFLGIEQSVVVDGRWTRVNASNQVKLVLWYDNEWGYTHRVLDAVKLVTKPIE